MPKKFTPEEQLTIDRVGQRIRQLRNHLAISQSELALRSDIPINQIGRIERGEINTTILTLERIAKSLEVQLFELFQST